MTPTIEQIKEILAGAPDGMNHIGVYQGDIVPMPNSCGDVHNLSDLREILTLRQRVQELETQVRSIALSRDELAATVERLRDLLTIAFEQSEEVEEFLLASGGQNHNLIAKQINEWSKDTEAALSETQQQNLAELKAEVARKAFIAGCSCGDKYGIFEWDRQADEYAQRIKDGES